MEFLKVCGLILLLLNVVFGQENAGTNVAPSLEVCYNNTRLATREYRLPSTTNVLVELVRRAENGNPNQDARELSFQLLHRFRQDGIRRTLKDIDISQGLPYSPSRVESFKNKVQLMRLTPGNAINFNNESLSDLQACSLHFMISSTVEAQARNDESSVCNKIAHYTLRHKRQIELTETGISSCPIESGVVYSKWGAVKAGLVLAGIAAGYQHQKIPTTNGSVDNIYGSTIAGELSEFAVYLGKTVGNKGGFNSSVEPKSYFLDQNAKESLYLTDAEIRGGLDGLFLGLNIESWKSKSNNIKISQILDMYYSRGVFNTSSRACNRKNLVQDLIQSDDLVQQTIIFSYLLDQYAQLGYTPIKSNFPSASQTAVESLRSYLSNNLNDLQCNAEADIIERVSTDILIFIDTRWNYQIIQPIVSYILENIDVNKYESSYTVYDGYGNIIINKSRSILDFYENYNITVHQNCVPDLDYNRVIQLSETTFRAKLNNETDLTGQSTIILMLPRNTPTSTQSDYVRSKRNDFRTTLPDLRIIVGGLGSQTSYNDLVTNANSDIFTIQDSTEDSTMKSTASSLVDRIRKIPRSVVNPSCGSSFTSDATHNFDHVQYVEPSGINYHKIASNYFYAGSTLKIRGESYGNIVVCISRTDTNPIANTTGIDCKTSEEISIDISNYCSDEDVIDCSPIYISVQGVSSNVRCTDSNACRFPDNIKYTISIENTQCSSSNVILLNGFMFVFLLFWVMRF